MRGQVACPESHRKWPRQDLTSSPFGAKAQALSQPASHLHTRLLEMSSLRKEVGAWCSLLL